MRHLARLKTLPRASLFAYGTPVRGESRPARFPHARLNVPDPVPPVGPKK